MPQRKIGRSRPLARMRPRITLHPAVRRRRPRHRQLLRHRTQLLRRLERAGQMDRLRRRLPRSSRRRMSLARRISCPSPFCWNVVLPGAVLLLELVPCLVSGRGRLAFARRLLRLSVAVVESASVSQPHPRTNSASHRHQRDNRHRTPKPAPGARHGRIALPTHIIHSNRVPDSSPQHSTPNLSRYVSETFNGRLRVLRFIIYIVLVPSQCQRLRCGKYFSLCMQRFSLSRAQIYRSQ